VNESFTATDALADRGIFR